MGVYQTMVGFRSINRSNPYKNRYTEQWRINKQRQKLHGKISKLESSVKIKHAIINIKCNDARVHQEACYLLWCELDEITDQIVELKHEIVKYEGN